jgi:hypothetical protein
VRLTYQGYLATGERIFDIFMTGKRNSSRAGRPSAQEYPDFFERLFGNMEVLKCDSYPIMNYWKQGELASCKPLFFILAASKCDSSRVVRNSAEGYLASIEALFGILVGLKCVSSRVMRILTEEYLAFGEKSFSI